MFFNPVIDKLITYWDILFYVYYTNLKSNVLKRYHVSMYEPFANRPCLGVSCNQSLTKSIHYELHHKNA